MATLLVFLITIPSSNPSSPPLLYRIPEPIRRDFSLSPRGGGQQPLDELHDDRTGSVYEHVCSLLEDWGYITTTVWAWSQGRFQEATLVPVDRLSLYLSETFQSFGINLSDNPLTPRPQAMINIRGLQRLELHSEFSYFAGTDEIPDVVIEIQPEEIQSESERLPPRTTEIHPALEEALQTLLEVLRELRQMRPPTSVFHFIFMLLEQKGISSAWVSGRNGGSYREGVVLPIFEVRAQVEEILGEFGIDLTNPAATPTPQCYIIVGGIQDINVHSEFEYSESCSSIEDLLYQDTPIITINPEQPEQPEQPQTSPRRPNSSYSAARDLLAELLAEEDDPPEEPPAAAGA